MTDAEISKLTTYTEGNLNISYVLDDLEGNYTCSDGDKSLTDVFAEIQKCLLGEYGDTLEDTPIKRVKKIEIWINQDARSSNEEFKPNIIFAKEHEIEGNTCREVLVAKDDHDTIPTATCRELDLVPTCKLPYRVEEDGSKTMVKTGDECKVEKCNNPILGATDMGICDACEDALPDEALVGVGDHERLGLDYQSLCEKCYDDAIATDEVKYFPEGLVEDADLDEMERDGLLESKMIDGKKCYRINRKIVEGMRKQQREEPQRVFESDRDYAERIRTDI